MDLNRHTERSLDTDVVLDALLRCAATPMGERHLAQVQPLELAAIHQLYEAVDEWSGLLAAGGAPSLGGTEDIGARVRGAQKGEVLEPSDLVAIGRTIEVLERAMAVLLEAETVVHLAQIAGRIQVDPWLRSELLGSFEPDGRLSAVRYPELGSLRRQIEQIHGNLRSTLDRMAKGPEFADDLQDAFWTIRNDRYVLPLKPHAKNKGVVHGTSGSGKTVFVEPHEVLELNNRLRLAEGALAAEERRILAALSRSVGAEAEPMGRSLVALVELDAIAARAELGRRLGGRTVRVGNEGVVQLNEARHPVLVLRGIDVIGHDLALSSRQPALVLTGPNTGGKTVALKTIGLCAWMVQRALPIPVASGRLDDFSAILADVGDAQTVNDDLSSFSAQLVAVREMLERSGPGVLLLLDELASGTDPTQGAALARAVLEELVLRGARVVTTTHYPPLKGLAATDPRFAVAAMEVRDGLPTYRLLQGATGESHALSTAARLGLPAEVLERAESLWEAGDAGVSRTLEALEVDRAAVQHRLDELASERAELARLRAELERRDATIQRGGKALEEKAAAAFRERLAKATKAIGAVVAQLQDNPSHRGVAAARASLQAMEGLLPAPKPLPRAPVVDPSVFAVGDRVRHGAFGVGEVVQVGKSLIVRFGAMQSAVKPRDLQRVGGAAPRVAPVVLPQPEPIEAVLPDALRMEGNTIDLRGLRVDEAMDKVDRGLADAAADGIGVVFVLHGHGTGVLKQAIRGSLSGHPQVARHAPANSDQGGDAFTVVAVRT